MYSARNVPSALISKTGNWQPTLVATMKKPMPLVRSLGRPPVNSKPANNGAIADPGHGGLAGQNLHAAKAERVRHPPVILNWCFPAKVLPPGGDNANTNRPCPSVRDRISSTAYHGSVSGGSASMGGWKSNLSCSRATRPPLRLSPRDPPCAECLQCGPIFRVICGDATSWFRRRERSLRGSARPATAHFRTVAG